MMRFEEISVVIQGPVQSYQGRPQEEGITHKCIASIRQFLPGATVILSTWEGQDCTGLEPDLLLLNQDPGGTIAAYGADGTPGKLNFNRQLVSSAAGLRAVKTPYAVKIRSDNYLTGNGFVAAQQAFPERNSQDVLFAERVVVNTSYFRKYADGKRLVMLPSDFFHFGRTEDLLKIWDIPLFPDLEYDPAKAGQAQFYGAPMTPPHAEQMYCNAWLGELDKRAPRLAYRHHATAQMREYWDRFIASNFVVLEPAQIGLGLIQRFIPKKKRPNEISYLDWELLYKQYCDPQYPASRLKLFTTIGWRRMVKLPFSYLKFTLTKGK
ncbi:WavE lipopolysaccharide synthesis family protein [Shewanella sp. GXUN23E]|uniref:WavE lipopolysaccharide synthesis family protein n=1 Tax=Shewanella sp. GXUN23E TaxID=3422498 RepID=UPI003D7EAD9D